MAVDLATYEGLKLIFFVFNIFISFHKAKFSII
jgi:hypothetical protein